MTQYIISANYLNRSSATHPWLIREPHQTIDEAIPVASLTARNVDFQDSGTLERGLGCEIVAVSSDVDFQKDPEDAGVISTAPVGRGLRFYGHKFVSKATEEVVESVATLVLSADRKVTDVSEGVVPDDTNSVPDTTPDFPRGSRVVFVDKKARSSHAPSDMVGDGDMIVVSFRVDSDDTIEVHYDDGQVAGDTFWVDPKYLKLA